MEQAYRPSHADATYDFKYGIRAVSAGPLLPLLPLLPLRRAPWFQGGCALRLAGVHMLGWVNWMVGALQTSSCLCSAALPSALFTFL